jgi:hypothetical protein
MGSMSIGDLFHHDFKCATEISYSLTQKCTAVVVQRDGTCLVFGPEIPIDWSGMRFPGFAAGKKYSWSRQCIRIDPRSRREIKTVRQRIQRQRENRRPEMHLAPDIKSLEMLEKQIRKVPDDVQHGVMTIAPHGQFWLHVAKVRKGNQKGRSHLEQWLDARRDRVRLSTPSDVMRYFEHLYADTDIRFGPPIEFSPFESDSTVAEMGFPDSLWPTEFTSIDGNPARPKSREEPESHICIGLLSEPFADCVREIASCERVSNALDDIKNGVRFGNHRTEQQRDDYEHLEPEMLDPRRLKEYAWVAAAKALAGPPSASYYKARKDKFVEWKRVDDYACHVLYKLVFSTDRMLMRKTAEDSALDDAASLTVAIISNSFSAWSIVRKLIDNSSLSENQNTVNHNRIVQLGAELSRHISGAKSPSQLTSAHTAMQNLLRLTLQYERYDLASSLASELDNLILENPDDGALERIRLYYSWRTQ